MLALDPDILETTRQLSPEISGGVTLLGLGLWLVGGYTHRFWLTLFVTCGAGILGLNLSREFSVQPLVVGLLMAMAAGTLALAVSRIGLFIAGGFAGIMISRLGIPHSNELLAFLVGGLVGIFFYNLWIISLSSLVGTFITAYGLASLLDKMKQVDSISLASQHSPLINWIIIGATITGIIFQLLMERMRGKGKQKQTKGRKTPEKKTFAAPPPPPPPPMPSANPWWRKFGRAA
ncbi:MAG: hypothetical protein ACKO23_15630 [Gemmataceae bacterium]